MSLLRFGVPIVLCLALPLAPALAAAESIQVQIKGFDDGVRTSQQDDYKQAVLFAKREAIERAGVRVKSMTTVQEFVLQSDYIESTADAVLLPGYSILDIGYQSDGTYLVVLTGEVALQAPAGQPEQTPLVTALTALGSAPQDYIWDLGSLLGEYEIEKAYFAPGNSFVIHYTANNGIMVLENVDQGTMLLSGTYSTSKDKGTARLDFNSDGSAEGEWRNFLSGGKIVIRKRD